MVYSFLPFADKSKINENIERQLHVLDVTLFDLLSITTATNNFSLNNKIGQGGFGPVYKVIQYLSTRDKRNN